MRTLYVTIKDHRYPVRVTMGAMLDFKRETGKDVSEMEDGDLETLLMWMWCCMRSASRADGIAFDYGFDETCDLLTPDAVASWNAAQAEEDKKKE